MQGEPSKLRYSFQEKDFGFVVAALAVQRQPAKAVTTNQNPKMIILTSIERVYADQFSSILGRVGL